MASRFLRTMAPRPTSALTRSFFQPSRASVLQPSLSRSFASPSQDNSASPGQSSNVSNPQAASPEAQEVNQSRATDSRSSPDTASVQTPVSNPEESGLGGQEEPTESQDKMKRDPSEPDSKKREEVLKHGQNKKLDPADD